MKTSKSQQKQKETDKELSKVQEVNIMLIEDIKTLNDRLLVFVPGAVEKENSELRETLSMLHTVIDMYKQAEIEAEEYENEEVEENYDTEYGLNQVVFQCQSCEYRSNSHRG